MAALGRPTILVAAHSLLDGDAVCRFLDQQRSVEVVAEVRSARVLADAVAVHQPAVLVLSHCLPEMPVRPFQLVQSLRIPPRQIIYILPDSLTDPAFAIGLRKLGVRHLLRGAFTGDTLLELLTAALPPLTRIACHRPSGSIGQSTVALGLFLYCLGHGTPAFLMDRSGDGLLFQSLSVHPTLAAVCGSMLLEHTSSFPTAPAVTIIDGDCESVPSRQVTILSAPILRRQKSPQPAVQGELQVANQVLGRCRPPANTALVLPKLSPAPVDLLVTGLPIPAQALVPFRPLFHQLRLQEVTALATAQQSESIGGLQPGGDSPH